jgi:hypothetical protein
VCAVAVLSVQAGAAEQCGIAATLPGVRAAVARIEASVDPCGETAEIRAIVERFRQCAAGARLCIDDDAVRNLTQSRDGGQPTTITWNPTLRTAIEPYCSTGDRPLRRDPIASLLHEIVHAVQDCDGLDIAAHELEAVRVENIYRRAQGLCQRTGYGDEPLRQPQRIACAPGDCPCTPGEQRIAPRHLQSAMADSGVDAAGDAADAAATAFDASERPADRR